MGVYVSADYMWDHPLWKQIVFVVDILLISMLYFMTGIAFSAWFNDEFIGELDRNKGRLTIFAQTMGEGLLTIGAVYLIIHFMPKIPSLVWDPPEEHLNFRLRGADILLAFSIVSCQLLYMDKLRYLYNEFKDGEEEIKDEIFDNWNNCINGINPAGEFACL